MDNDQELVGQGLGNVASALFGGIPVTGVIARSATNIQSGARSRLSAILHALILLASMLFLGPIVTRIPLAALAGVLTAVALRMIEVRMLRVLWRGSRPEAVVFLVTSGAILATDLIDGVQIGLIATVLYFVYEMSNMKLRPIPLAHQSTDDEQEAEVIHCPRGSSCTSRARCSLPGFHVRNTMNRLNSYRCVILDLEGVSFLDVTGTQILDEEATLLHQQGIEVFLARPTEAVRQRLSTLAGDEFPAIQVCPIFDTLTDAMRHADRAIECGTVSVRGVRRRYGVSPGGGPLRKNGDPGTPGRWAPRGSAGLASIRAELPTSCRNADVLAGHDRRPCAVRAARSRRWRCRCRWRSPTRLGLQAVGGPGDAIVGGIVAPLRGCGSRFGTAAAMTFLVDQVITKYGMGGLIAATLMAALPASRGGSSAGRFIELHRVQWSQASCRASSKPRPVGDLGYDEVVYEEQRRLRELAGAAPARHTRCARVAVRPDALAVMLPAAARAGPPTPIAVAVASRTAHCRCTRSRAWKLRLFADTAMSPGVSWEEWEELVMAAADDLPAGLADLLYWPRQSMAKQRHADNDQELVGQGPGNAALGAVRGHPGDGC